MSYIWMRTHCNTLQRTAIHCNTLQHTATHCNTLYMTRHTYTYDMFQSLVVSHSYVWRVTYSVLQCVAVCRSVLQCIAVRCSVLNTSYIWMRHVTHTHMNETRLLQILLKIPLFAKCVAVRCSVLKTSDIWMTHITHHTYTYERDTSMTDST